MFPFTRWLFPSTSGVAYPLTTRLWTLHIGCAIPATAPFCAQRCSSSGVSASTLRPHHWCYCSPSLAACTTTGRLQGCGHGVSSTEWSASGSARSCCWSAWSSSSALILITPAARSGVSSTYRRPTFVSSCCINRLQQSVSWYSVILLLEQFLPQTKPTTIPDINYVSIEFIMTLVILAMLKNSELLLLLFIKSICERVDWVHVAANSQTKLTEPL